jgi:hypothetical protein
MNVPIVDLKTQCQQIAAEVNEAMQRIVSNAEFILGDDLTAVETEFANYAVRRSA